MYTDGFFAQFTANIYTVQYEARKTKRAISLRVVYEYTSY